MSCNFSDEEAETLLIVRVSFASFSALITGGTVLFLIYTYVDRCISEMKCHGTTVFGRLLLYLAIASFLSESTFVMQAEAIPHLGRGGSDEFCRFIGYTIEVTSWAVLLFTLSITVYLLYATATATATDRDNVPRNEGDMEKTEYELQERAVHSDEDTDDVSTQARDEQAGPPQAQHNEAKHSCLHCSWDSVYAFIAVIFSLVVSAFVFINEGYGRSGPWCWIPSITSDCDKYLAGFLEQIFMWYLPFVVIGFAVVVCSGLTVFLAFYERHYNHKKSQYIKPCKAFWVWFFLCVFIVLNFAEMVARFTDFADPSRTRSLYALWGVYAALAPLSLAVIPLTFVSYIYNIREATFMQY